MARLAHALRELTDRYCEVHQRKEDLFWSVKMGLAADSVAARGQAAEAEKEWNRFLQSPERLASLRELGSEPGTDDERVALQGWIAMLEAHVVEDPEGRKLSEEIVELEAELERRRMDMPLGFVDPETRLRVPASSVKLMLMMRTDPSEARRKAAFEGLRSIEPFVLGAGFLDIVRKRNQLGRLLGYEDFYDWRVSVVERMRKARLFRTLDDLASRTAERTRASVAAFAALHGDDALLPWNFGFLRLGELTDQIDPYMAFGKSFERWGRSFHALGVRYRGATLTLDLVDRPGKYENGFMHGPEIAFFDEGRWRPARINFTANAVVGQAGSGKRATETLFHEGGHAAHFSNILRNAPCFAHEFAPTSVAYSETQSMFMDSLLDDADWRARYATNAAGEAMPLALMEAAVEEQQPFRGWDVRSMLTIPFAERALYEIPDAELGPERVLADVRRIERELQGLTDGIRPVLAVPHLLAGEASAYYHGYILAEMAVQQTRRFFRERDGYLTDNPRIGPDLAASYWAPGNSVGFDALLRALTGSPLAADALVDVCNRSTDEARADLSGQIDRGARIARGDAPVELGGTVRVVHGRDTIVEMQDGDFETACRGFERWIGDLEKAAAGAASR